MKRYATLYSEVLTNALSNNQEFGGVRRYCFDKQVHVDNLGWPYDSEGTPWIWQIAGPCDGSCAPEQQPRFDVLKTPIGSVKVDGQTVDLFLPNPPAEIVMTSPEGVLLLTNMDDMGYCEQISCHGKRRHLILRDDIFGGAREMEVEPCAPARCHPRQARLPKRTFRLIMEYLHHHQAFVSIGA